AKDALPALRERLREQNLHEQFQAAEAMLMIDPAAAGAVEVLKREDMMREMTLYSACALALVPAEVETALPILIKSLEDEMLWRGDRPTQGFAGLGARNGAPAAAKLQAMAKEAQEASRLEAAETLVTLTGKPDDLLMVIDQELANKSSERRV